MVFKRRNKRPIWQAVAEFLWPRTGWVRAFRYVRHRLWRLPDPPHRIARGIFAGIFVTFTPFFGLHFFLAAFVAFILRGNIVAALLATFVGNPPTFIVIATLSLSTGHYLLGRPPPEEVTESTFEVFWSSTKAFFNNIGAGFTDAEADWSLLAGFYHEIFYPYMVGGIIPGVICGLIGYYVSLPVIQAYQNRRKGRLKAKLLELKQKAAAKADAKKKAE